VGGYTLRHVDMDADYREMFITLFRVIEKCMHKVSLPDERKWVYTNLPILMTKLEMAMPTIWNTFVVHLFVFHTVAILEAAGPYCEINMLDVERFHTRFKTFARGTNVMASIKTNFEIMEASQQNRLVEEMEWTAPAQRSSAAGLAARADSANKKDRCVEPKGKSTKGVLNDADLLQVQDLWAIDVPAYDRFRDRFATYNRRRSPSSQTTHIKDWVENRQTKFSDDEKLWQTMSPTVQVHPNHQLGISCCRMHCLVSYDGLCSYDHTMVFYCRMHSLVSYDVLCSYDCTMESCVSAALRTRGIWWLHFRHEKIPDQQQARQLPPPC
jgi:hypothetical protein